MLPEGMSYTIDGDIIDRRDSLIKELQSEVLSLRRKENEWRETVIREKQLRIAYPALQELWEQYQLMLKVVKHE